MKIYTRTGDQGKTALFSGQRVFKDDPFIQAVGSVDEANSTLGQALSFMPKDMRLKEIKKEIEHIQHTLFDIGAALSTPLTMATERKIEKTRFDQSAIELLEKWIDHMEEALPPLHTFILPGGHPAGATLHIARTLIRRAERAVVPLYETGNVSPEVLIYLNRLSDYLFVVSRFVNHFLEIPEIPWKPHS